MFKEGIPASLIIIVVFAVLISAIAATYWQYTKTYESNNVEELVGKTPEFEEEAVESENGVKSQTGTESMSENKNLVRKDFSYPYPIEWVSYYTKTRRSFK